MFKRMMIGNTKENAFLRGLIVSFLVCFSMILISALAACAEVEAKEVLPLQTGPDAVRALLDNVVFPIFTGLILSLLSILIHRLSSKYKLDILVANQELIERAALQGISLAEEKAAQYIDIKISGNEKLTMALTHVKSVIPTITTAQAQSVIEGMLARIPGLGATGDKAITPPAPLLT